MSEILERTIEIALAEKPPLLDLTGSYNLSESDVAQIGTMTFLTRLVLDRCDIKPEQLKEIAHLTDLVELSMSGHTAGSALFELRPLTKLERLDISEDFSTGDDNVRRLFGLPSWALLANWRTPALQNLTHIGLRRTSVSDAVSLTLKRLEKLRSIDLKETDTGDGAIAHLAGLPLEDIALGRNVTDFGLFSLPNSIKGIDLDRNRDWHGNDLITVEGFAKFVGKHPQLERLRLFAPKVGDVMPWIALLPSLQSLSIIGDFNDRSLTFLSELTQLHSLYVNTDFCRHTWVPALQACIKLTDLIITGSAFNDDAIPALSELKQLKELRLDFTGVSTAGVQRLRESLPDCNVHQSMRHIGRRFTAM